MNQNQIEAELAILSDSLQVVDDKVECWFVRTAGGAYFDNFLGYEYIGIGWELISIEDVKRAVSSPNKKDVLQELVALRYPEQLQPGRITSQILRFYESMKVGDLVMFPYDRGAHIAICEVISDVIPIEKHMLDDCPYVLNRKVRILDLSPKFLFSDGLKRLFYSHNALSKFNGDLTEVFRMAFGAFRYKGRFYVKISIRTFDPVSANDMFLAGYESIKLTEEFLEISSDDLDVPEVEAKVNVQSPGWFEFASDSYKIVVLMLVVHSLLPHEVKVNFAGIKLNVKTPGLLGLLLKFKKDKAERLMRLNKAYDRLDARLDHKKKGKKR